MPEIVAFKARWSRTETVPDFDDEPVEVEEEEEEEGQDGD